MHAVPGSSVTPGPGQRRRGVDTIRTVGACLLGAGAELVHVEARFQGSDAERTEVVLSGLPDAVLRESKGRVLSALQAARFRVGPGRLLWHLLPAARRKRGGSLDLALALSAAAAVGHFDGKRLGGILFLGELGIDGTLHDVPGGVASAYTAQRAGLVQVIAPPRTAREAACVPGIRSHGARHLVEVVAHLCDPARTLPALKATTESPGRSSERADAALDRIRGQGEAKWALGVAAAGGHGLLMSGPPGVGKSLLARALPSLMPRPSLEECLEITALQSAAGLWPGGLTVERPFRAPHHTASHAGLVGGGSPPGPGEVSLAHRGVLFLDEIPEFRRETLEALRQPIEAGEVLLCRAGETLRLPSRFQLIAAMNPCPCGHAGNPRRPCRCTPHQVERYRQRISGPLLDRIDLHLELQAPEFHELLPASGSSPPPPGPRGSELLERIEAARQGMQARQGPRPNAELDADELDQWSRPEGQGLTLLQRAADKKGLGARALQSIRRVARTLADLEGCETPSTTHLAQAVALRSERTQASST